MAKSSRTMDTLLSAVKRGDHEQVRACIAEGCDVNETDTEGRTALYHAFRLGREDIADTLVAASCSTNARDDSERTPIESAGQTDRSSLVQPGNVGTNTTGVTVVSAVRRLDLLQVRISINAGCDVNETDMNGRTPLHHAVKNNRLDMVRFLLRAGARINGLDGFGLTPLHYAVMRNRLEIVHYLVAKGGQINEIDHFKLLQNVMRNRNMDMVRALVGSRLTTGHGLAHVMLRIAVKVDSLDIVRLLVRLRAPVAEVTPNNRRSLLHEVVRRNSPFMVRMLVDAGCEVNARDARGRTPLDYARQTRAEDMERELLAVIGAIDVSGVADKTNRTREEGVQLNLPSEQRPSVRSSSIDSFSGMSPAPRQARTRTTTCSTLVSVVRSGDLQQVRACIAKGCDVNERDQKGLTALHHAAINNSLSILCVLIAGGASIYIGDGVGRAVFFEAVWRYRVAIVRRLVEAGARIDGGDGEGMAALREAVIERRPYMVRALVAAGCDIRMRDVTGRTLLDYARQSSTSYMVQLLIAAGVTDDTGITDAWTRANNDGDVQVHTPSLPSSSIFGSDPGRLSSSSSDGSQVHVRRHLSVPVSDGYDETTTCRGAVRPLVPDASQDAVNRPDPDASLGVNRSDPGALLGVNRPDPDASLGVNRPDPDASLGVNRPDPGALLGVNRPDPDALLGVNRPDPGALLGVNRPDPDASLGVNRPDPDASLAGVGSEQLFIPTESKDSGRGSDVDNSTRSGGVHLYLPSEPTDSVKGSDIDSSIRGVEGGVQINLLSKSQLNVWGSDIDSSSDVGNMVYLPSEPPSSEWGSDVISLPNAEAIAQLHLPSLQPVSERESDSDSFIRSGDVQLYIPSEPPAVVWVHDIDSSSDTSNFEHIGAIDPSVLGAPEYEADQPEPDATELAVSDDTITITVTRDNMIQVLYRGHATREPNPVALVRDTTGDMCHQLFDDGLVHVRNVHGEFIRDVVIRGPNDRRVRPTGMAVTPDGYFISEQNHVFMCSFDGCFIREIADYATASPDPDGGVHGMVYHDRRVYAATPHSIYVFNADDGNRIAELHNPANGPCDLDIFMSDDGLRIYLSDWRHDRVHVLDESGNVVNTFGDSAAGQLSNPKGISVSDDGYCYVADSQHGAVNVYTVSDGQLHHRIQADGRGFGRVIDVVAMADGTIIICTAEGLYVMRK